MILFIFSKSFKKINVRSSQGNQLFGTTILLNLFELSKYIILLTMHYALSSIERILLLLCIQLKDQADLRIKIDTQDHSK